MSTNPPLFEQAATGQLSYLPADGQGKIILCDCNGTLFGEMYHQGFNRPLFDFLVAAEKRGYIVRLHSGAAQSNMDTIVPMAGLRNKDFKAWIARHEAENELGAIMDKGEIPSKDAFLTIDDEHGGGFISSAPNQWSPTDTRIANTMTAWGETGGTKPSGTTPVNRP